MGLGVVPFLVKLLALVQTCLELYGWSSDKEAPDRLASIPQADSSTKIRFTNGSMVSGQAIMSLKT